MLLLGLAAHPRHAGHGLDVTLAHGRWMQDGFGGPRQAHRQPRSAQQDPGHPWGVSVAVRGWVDFQPRPPPPLALPSLGVHVRPFPQTPSTCLHPGFLRLSVGWVGPTPHPHPSSPPSIPISHPHPRRSAFCGLLPPQCHGPMVGVFPVGPAHQLVKGRGHRAVSWGYLLVGPALPPCPGLDLTCQGRVNRPGTIQVLHREGGDPEGRREEAAAGFQPHTRRSDDCGLPSGYGFRA